METKTYVDFVLSHDKWSKQSCDTLVKMVEAYNQAHDAGRYSPGSEYVDVFGNLLNDIFMSDLRVKFDKVDSGLSVKGDYVDINTLVNVFSTAMKVLDIEDRIAVDWVSVGGENPKFSAGLVIFHKDGRLYDSTLKEIKANVLSAGVRQNDTPDDFANQLAKASSIYNQMTEAGYTPKVRQYCFATLVYWSKELPDGLHTQVFNQEAWRNGQNSLDGSPDEREWVFIVSNETDELNSITVDEHLSLKKIAELTELVPMAFEGNYSCETAEDATALLIGLNSMSPAISSRP
ncbi:hypothetical protein ACFOY8_15080 [Thalassospira xianhensis]|uniref:Uncharacterized protein n=1 Tax=Thalassospira xianhensis MCCC 1A02616 TaxID=1177929 RepID=A0A367UK88_9PROT|nr:hypothetical protein [Thalassospira xianhensis]RCK07532.1 hypothetical protein TH5_00145 [Thalassospira xianhensis MCCC 1A02616]